MIYHTSNTEPYSARQMSLTVIHVFYLFMLSILLLLFLCSNHTRNIVCNFNSYFWLCFSSLFFFKWVIFLQLNLFYLFPNINYFLFTDTLDNLNIKCTLLKKVCCLFPGPSLLAHPGCGCLPASLPTLSPLSALRPQRGHLRDQTG